MVHLGSICHPAHTIFNYICMQIILTFLFFALKIPNFKGASKSFLMGTNLSENFQNDLFSGTEVVIYYFFRLLIYNFLGNNLF